MPCQSDYLEPNGAELASREVAVNLSYLMAALGMEVPVTISKAAENLYGDKYNLENFTQALCKLCSELTITETNEYLYDGRNKKARRLADWWEHHQEADAKRLRDERSTKKKEELKKQALAKLSAEERRVLGL